MLSALGLPGAAVIVGVLVYLALPLPLAIIAGLYFRPGSGRRQGLARPGYLKMLRVMLRPERSAIGWRMPAPRRWLRSIPRA